MSIAALYVPRGLLFLTIDCCVMSCAVGTAILRWGHHCSARNKDQKLVSGFLKIGYFTGYWLLSHWKCTGNMADQNGFWSAKCWNLSENGQWPSVISSTALINILFAVYCCMFCDVGDCCFLLLYVVYCRMFVPWVMLLCILYVDYGMSACFCAVGIAASYYCMQYTAMCCGHCRFVPRALLHNTSYAVDHHIFCVYY